MPEEFGSLRVFAAYSRWSLDNSSFGRMEYDKVSSKLPNSKGHDFLAKLHIWKRENDNPAQVI